MTRWTAALTHVVMMASRWSASNVRRAPRSGVPLTCTTCTIVSVSPKGTRDGTDDGVDALERIHPVTSSNVQERSATGP